jgi:hypothetical protein
MEEKINIKNACSKFVKLFKSIHFNTTTLPKRKADPELLRDSEAHIERMIAAQKKKLSKAYKSHRAGKMSREEVIDHEFRLFELEDELKKIQEEGGEEID